MKKPLFIVPTLTLRQPDGEIDAGATAAYAQKAAGTWIDYFFLSGSIGGGYASSPRNRQKTVEIWLEKVAGNRLLACAWTEEDYTYLKELGVRPVAVLQGLENSADLLALLGDLPSNAFVYSHPRYTRETFSPANAALAAQEGVLPAGAKVSKIELGDLARLREAVGPDFLLFDGRSRHIQASLQAGASGVVVVPLTTFPHELPDRTDLEALQVLINQMHTRLDAESTLADQAAMLTGILRSTI